MTPCYSRGSEAARANNAGRPRDISVRNRGMRRLRTSITHHEHTLQRGAGPIFSQRGRLWQIFLCLPILFVAAEVARRGGCRPISQLERAALATAIGSEISLLQSGSSQQPKQVVIFRPQVFSPALSPALAALRLPCPRTELLPSSSGRSKAAQW